MAGYGLDGRRVGVRIPVGARFSPFHKSYVHVCSPHGGNKRLKAVQNKILREICDSRKGEVILEGLKFCIIGITLCTSYLIPLR
jgi:hypothetical protein